MVEDRVLEEIRTKARNLLKHYPCRKLRLTDVSEIVSDPGVGFAIRLAAVGPEWNFETISLFKKKDLKDPSLAKRCVEKIMLAIPKKFSDLRVTNVQDTAKDLMHNFVSRSIPDCFNIEKLPYRQLQIVCEENRSFLKVNIKSYQRLLALLEQEKEWPAEISFEKLAECLKRKELVTLLLYLSKSSV